MLFTVYADKVYKLSDNILGRNVSKEDYQSDNETELNTAKLCGEQLNNLMLK